MLRRDHGRRGVRGRRSPRFLIALRTKGETVEELAGLARTMRALATPVRRDRDDLLDTAGHRRRAADVQRLDDRGADRRRRRLRGRQARQPLGDRACRARPTCSRRSARGSTSTPSAVARCIDEAGFGFMFAPAHHAATRYVVPVRKELGGAHDLQLPRPADQPGRARRASSSASSDPAFLEHDGGRAGAARRRPGAGSVQRGRAGRDEHVGADPRRRGQRRGASSATRSRPRTSASREAPPEARRRRHAARTTPRRRARSSPASPGPRARPGAAQRRRGDLRRRRGPTSLADGVGAPREADRRRAPRPRALERLRRAQRGAAPARHERARADRRGRRARRSRRRREQVPLAELERGASPRGRDGRPFSEALAAPASRVIAEHKRRSPSAGEIRAGRDRSSEIVARLRARRRGGAVGAHRGRRTSAARSTTCARRARPRDCRSCARTSSSTPTRSTRPPPPAPTRCC